VSRRRTLDDRRYLADDDYRRLRRHVGDLRLLGLAKGSKLPVRNATIVDTLLGTGLRRAELAALQVGDLRLGRGRREVVVRHGKGDERRVVHISADLARLLREWLAFRIGVGWPSDEASPLFPSTRAGGHLDPSAINRLWNATLAAAGVHRHPGTGPHSARHTHGTRLYAATRDLRLVQDELGHADPSTTAIYAHVATERKLAAADAAFAIDSDEWPAIGGRAAGSRASATRLAKGRVGGGERAGSSRGTRGCHPREASPPERAHVGVPLRSPDQSLRATPWKRARPLAPPRGA